MLGLGTHRRLALTVALSLLGFEARAAPPRDPELPRAAEAEAPIEGPRRPPPIEETTPEEPSEPGQPLPPPRIEFDPDASIDFAVQPPPEARPAPARSTDERHEPGTAPDSGTGWLVIGSYILPMTAYGAAYLTIGLTWSERFHRPTILATGGAIAGLAILGGASIGIGAYRQVKLARWARAHHVIALPQGRGLLVAATLALFTPAALISSGVQIYRSGAEGIGAGVIATSAAILISSPIMFVIGARRARRLQQTGGWKRPGAHPATRRQLAPSLAPVWTDAAPSGLTLGLRGRL